VTPPIQSNDTQSQSRRRSRYLGIKQQGLLRTCCWLDKLKKEIEQGLDLGLIKEEESS